ncbi:PREDICTED: methylmalonic aciduria and homocystinuria type D homolog, mitochondrial [Dinoponera quadriceps]|uniref:Methylmalonic aciduria and homocystinuria type D homolog, mitochondrial n=1 Tax=Dinoponera quadriceps TaxID=609295 RepID=A0A6P3XRS9_DINQU|nr:PREDICTED: methylmalonic aciduria and homocystinuria type D homolog, mitochondrial [Dinoponera quadriceps]XP_014481081.1 PREDICTED: methylmalonic aciduria and homocystinuria type D homolog, mitochondrial [Dinoponera quadriceps]
MLCIKYGKRFSTPPLFNTLMRALYFRRSDRSTNSYINANGDSLDGVRSNMLDANSNWELLTPNGFRFYLPGSVGLAWLDVTTTAQMKTQFLETYDDEKFENLLNDRNKYQANMIKWKNVHSTLKCTAQECPVLLRKGIEELFPGTLLDMAASDLTIITISQKANPKLLRWRTDVETEKLAKYFVLAAVDMCLKLKMNGYWADFINPFSGQPYFTPRKDSNLYKTDERFRCLGFKVEEKKNCRIITADDSPRNFVGSLYTTAPSNTKFLKELINNN